MSTHTNHPASLTQPRSLLVGIALAILAAGISTPPAFGGSLTIEAPNVTASAGQTVSFDVLLVNNDLIGYQIAGDAFTLTLSPSIGVTFTDATTLTTTAPYIYQASSDVDLPTTLYDSLPGTSFTAADTVDLPYHYQQVDPGASFGLGNVTFSVAPTVAPNSVFQLILTPYSQFPAALNDQNLNYFPYDVVDGTITIVEIPEPSSLFMACISALSGLVIAWRRTRAGRLARLRMPKARDHARSLESQNS